MPVCRSGAGGLKDRQLIIAQLDVLAKMLIRVSVFVTRLAPLGVFAIAASTAGTMSLAELGRMQAYLIAYAGGAVFLVVVVLPWLITCCTPFTYRDVMRVSKDALVTAFATGKLIVVLPLLIEQTERLFAQSDDDTSGGAAPTVDVLYPLAYPFPHAGKLLGMLFIPFAAWFLGNALPWYDYPAFLAAGLFSYFGGPLLATPFLLDQLHLPHDMMQLFLLSGVFGERLGDAVGVMHLVAFTILTMCACTGRLRVRWRSLARFLVVVTLLGMLLVFGIRAGLRYALPEIESKETIIARMQLLNQPVAYEVVDAAASNPEPLLPGETLLQRIRRRGVIRVGFNGDKLPFAYFNRYGAVGFDISVAHELARDLGVRIEFVPYEQFTLADQLAADHFDVVMSGLVGTLERAETMQHTKPVSGSDPGAGRARLPGPRLQVCRNDATGPEVAARLRGPKPRTRRSHAQPAAQRRVRRTANQPTVLRLGGRILDGLLISAESGSAFTLFYPQYEVIVPDGPRISLPLFYAIANRDAGMRDFLEHWVSLRQKDGTMQENYDHWILGKSTRQSTPRWSVIRNVLGWGGVRLVVGCWLLVVGCWLLVPTRFTKSATSWRNSRSQSASCWYCWASPSTVAWRSPRVPARA